MTKNNNLELTKDMFTKLNDSEKNSEYIAYENKTFIRDAWDRFKTNKLALVGLGYMIVLILLSIFVPIISKYGYETQNLDNTFANPSLQHLLGTDNLGRDNLVRIMWGARFTLSIAFAAALINLFIGVVYGGVSGFIGGKLDMLMMRVIDIIYSVPSLLYTILILLIFGGNVFSMLIAISITSWMQMARQVRTQILSLKELEFALAAKVIGASKRRILGKHLIINAIGPIIVCLTMMIPSAIFTESSLSYLGIGIPAPTPTWGRLISECQAMVHVEPLQVVWPILFMSVTILSLNFIGDGIGQALEPKR